VRCAAGGVSELAGAGCCGPVGQPADKKTAKASCNAMEASCLV
jgi:hypothetical protein